LVFADVPGAEKIWWPNLWTQLSFRVPHPLRFSFLQSVRGLNFAAVRRTAIPVGTLCHLSEFSAVRRLSADRQATQISPARKRWEINGANLLPFALLNLSRAQSRGPRKPLSWILRFESVPGDFHAGALFLLSRERRSPERPCRVLAFSVAYVAPRFQRLPADRQAASSCCTSLPLALPEIGCGIIRIGLVGARGTLLN
jgi:hypothetical protein